MLRADGLHRHGSERRNDVPVDGGPVQLLGLRLAMNLHVGAHAPGREIDHGRFRLRLGRDRIEAALDAVDDGCRFAAPHVDRLPGAGPDPGRVSNPWDLAYCWVHWRRRFVEFQRGTASPVCEEILERIAALSRIEAMVRGHPPEHRLKVRQELSTPIVEALRPWVEAQLGRLSSASELARHIRYALKRY